MKSKPIRITPYRPRDNGVYCTTFIDPRNDRRLNRSLGTSDLTDAKQVCVDLERIVNDSQLWSLENESVRSLHPHALKIFFNEVPEPPSPYIPVGPGNILERGHGRRGGGLIRSEKYREAQQKIIDLERERTKLLSKVEGLNEENMRLQRETGTHVSTTIEEAADRFFKDEYKSRAAKTQEQARSAVNSFIAYVGGKTRIAKVKSGDVQGWLDSYRDPRTQAVVTPRSLQRLRAPLRFRN